MILAVNFGLVINAIKLGGVWMIPIIICLVFGLAIAMERLYYIAFRSNMNGTDMMKKVRDSIYSNKIEDALTRRSQNNCALREASQRAPLVVANDRGPVTDSTLA